MLILVVMTFEEWNNMLLCSEGLLKVAFKEITNHLNGYFLLRHRLQMAEREEQCLYMSKGERTERDGEMFIEITVHLFAPNLYAFDRVDEEAIYDVLIFTSPIAHFLVFISIQFL